MNTATDYAQTLLHMTQSSEAEFSFDNFIGLLKEKKQYKMLPAIMDKYQQLLTQQSADKTVLVVKDASMVDSLQSELHQYAKEFGTEYEVIEDKNIVGGFVLKNKTHMIDNSYRTKLITMYKKLIA